MSGTISDLRQLRNDEMTILPGMTSTDVGTLLCRSGRAWPGAMSILAGIDLLGKFCAGDDKPGDVGLRFKGFLSAYLHLSPADGEAVYHLRNALLHSFGLFSKAKTQKYRFQVDFGTNTTLISLIPGGFYLVDLMSLHTHFENAVEEYRQDVLANPVLQKRFAAMYPDYGAISITL